MDLKMTGRRTSDDIGVRRHLTVTTLTRVLTCLAGLVILRAVIRIVWNYHGYFPPDFESDFLHGRQAYFFGSYQWAFYPHIVVGPISLVLGMILMSDRLRMKHPKWHRYLGRVQVLGVLFVVAPSGLWMAYRAEAGPFAGIGFAVLAVLTAVTISMGWRSALRRQFAVHRRWMWRCFLCLCSTVVLRLMVGVTTVLDIPAPWIEPASAWLSWLAPLAVFELSVATRRYFTVWRRGVAMR
jgi:uncharacterized membrane protein